MTQLKRLLAATDLSAPARHAVDRAALVAREAGAQLELVHVADADFSPLDELRRVVASLPSDIVERVRDQSAMLMQVLATTMRERHGVAVATHVVSGSLLQAIEDAATHLDADLLVLGARGSSGVRQLVLGSTAARLAAAFSRPLLVVKHTATAAYRCVLVPVDFSDASLPALRMAQAVAPGARLVLMHAYEAPFEGKLRYAGVDQQSIEAYRQHAQAQAQSQMSSFCASAALPPEATVLLLQGPAARRILEQEVEQDCDLIVVGRRGQGRVQRMLLGSVSRRLLDASESDVLVVT